MANPTIPLASLFFICAAFPLFAADISDLTYVVNPDNTNTNTITITRCDTAASGELVIPDTIEGQPVTSIDDYGAFSGCTNLTSVTIGNNVTNIGAAAFHAATGLISVIIPDSVISIGSRAFRGCRIVVGPNYLLTSSHYPPVSRDRWVS